MSTSPLRFGRKTVDWKKTVVAFLLFAALVVLLQLWRRDAQKPFTAYPDEPSHYVSGVMIHDYMIHGALTSPVRFATEYYRHVPYFAVGYWPPLFYIAEAAWMTIFGIGRGAVLIGIAFVAAGSAALIFGSLQPQFGSLAAFTGGMIFLISPEVMWSTGIVMTDLAVTLLSLSAALAFAAFMDTGKAGAVLLFGVLSGATLLTKMSGGFLALLPVAALVAARRSDLLKKLSLWLAPVVVVAIYAPWFFISWHFATRGVDGFQKPSLPQTLYELGRCLLFNAGFLTPFAVIGALFVLSASPPWPGITTVSLVLPFCAVAFIALAPVGNEARYLIPAIPFVIILAFHGLDGLARHFGPRYRSAFVLAGAVSLTAVSFAQTAHPARLEGVNALRQMAQFVVTKGYKSVLVPTDVEGATIAEIVQIDTRRREHYLLRPNKLLAQRDWLGSYSGFYHSKEELQQLFERLPLDSILVRKNLTTDATPHEVLLLQMIEAFPERWQLVSRFDAGPESYMAYEPVRQVQPSESLDEYLDGLLGGPMGRSR